MHTQQSHTIILASSGRQLQVEAGHTLLQALIGAGIHIRSDCGGQGTCGKCQIRMQSGAGAASDSHNRGLVEQLACQTVVDRDFRLEIPSTSFAHAEVIIKPAFVRSLPHPRLAAGQIAPKGYGLAVDLGTTTIAVFLLDSQRGQVLASGSIRNPQVIFGDDVMSRISAIRADMLNLSRMQQLVVSAINDTASALTRQCDLEREQIRNVIVVGNSTMMHIMAGEDPGSLGMYPFQPVFSAAREFAAKDIGLTFHPETSLKMLPLISGFLGSDIIAATLAANVDAEADKTMIVDVGTNGEIMLNVNGELLATSCATGPALEGAAIRHGMHAVSGAIDAVHLDPETVQVRYSLIQRHPKQPKKAAGICGSGVVSAVAALLRAGVILVNGRFNPESRHPNLRDDDVGIPEFVLVAGEETQTGVDITLTQADIRAVQLAKGAILTGITLLCREAQIALPEHLLIAGAFGSFLNKADAMDIGMLPRLAEHALETVGNAAGEGAILALFNGAFEARARSIAHRARAVDLASHPDFQKVFLDALAFPDA